MQETLSPDMGFVVDWQLADDAPVVIDLSTADSELDLAVDPHVRSTLPHR